MVHAPKAGEGIIVEECMYQFTSSYDDTLKLT